ncbi:MAG: hypothetical protein J6K20_02000, partial [Thermoguttaceae bacterium]|nr:hypothetical protein [Thermoguttaceae bacterium]
MKREKASKREDREKATDALAETVEAAVEQVEERAGETLGEAVGDWVGEAAGSPFLLAQNFLRDMHSGTKVPANLPSTDNKVFKV